MEELEQTEKALALEAAQLQRQLAVLGLYSTSHRMSEETQIEGHHMPVSWTRGTQRYGLGCRCAGCMASLELDSLDRLPCRKAMTHTIQAIGQAGGEVPADSADRPVSGPQDEAGGDDFREHLRLFLAAGAGLASAKAAGTSVYESRVQGAPNDFPSEGFSREPAAMARLSATGVAVPEALSEPSAERGPSTAGAVPTLRTRPAEPIRPDATSMAAQQGLSQANMQRGLGSTASLAPTPHLQPQNMPHKKEGSTSGAIRKHLLQRKLQQMLTQPTAEAGATPPEPSEAPDQVEHAGASEDFATAFLQDISSSAREHRQTQAVAATPAQAAPFGSVLAEPEQPGDSERDPGLLDLAAGSPYPASAVPQPADTAGVSVVRVDQEPVKPPMSSHSPDRWKSASKFLKATYVPAPVITPDTQTPHPQIMEERQLLQRGELQLEAKAAVLRIADRMRHRAILQDFVRRRESDGSLAFARSTKRRTQAAERVLAVAMRGDRRLPGLRKALTRCVEATVAAYDAERFYAASEAQGQPVAELEREVARALQSISRCRRLFLDVPEVPKPTASQSNKTPSTLSGELKKADLFTPSLERQTRWAEVYADLLQIESNDASTITLCTQQGIAWAKLPKMASAEAGPAAT